MAEELIYIIMFASIAVSALCSTLEATLLSTPLSYITGLEEQGVKGIEVVKVADVPALCRALFKAD
mgnify:CR=1 FL=1